MCYSDVCMLCGSLSVLVLERVSFAVYVCVMLFCVYTCCCFCFFFFFSSRRRHTRCLSDWSSDVCSSDLTCLSRRRPATANCRSLRSRRRRKPPRLRSPRAADRHSRRAFRTSASRDRKSVV